MLYELHAVLENGVCVLLVGCINLLYACCIFVLYFSKKQNQLITGENKPEEQCESAHKNILKLTALQYALLLDNGSINNERTLTIKNLGVT